jgi:hypothetical protein
MRFAIWMLLLGCGGGGDKSEPAGSASGGGSGAAPAAAPTPRDAVIEAWKKGGLEPSALTAAKVPIGKDCQTGTVENVEVVLCNFASPAEAKAAEKPGWDWIGSTTGTAWVASGNVVVAAADRKKADPNGKTINRLMKLAPK